MQKQGDRHVLRTKIYTTTDLPAISSDVRVTASYETADCGRVCVLQKTAQLPVKMILKTCPPENTSTFTATLKCSEPLVAFSQLFPGKSISTALCIMSLLFSRPRHWRRSCSASRLVFANFSVDCYDEKVFVHKQLSKSSYSLKDRFMEITNFLSRKRKKFFY